MCKVYKIFEELSPEGLYIGDLHNKVGTFRIIEYAEGLGLKTFYNSPHTKESLEITDKNIDIIPNKIKKALQNYIKLNTRDKLDGRTVDHLLAVKDFSIWGEL